MAEEERKGTLQSIALLSLMSPGRGPTSIKRELNWCNTTVHVYSDMRSENSFLAGSKKGCEKEEKPQ